MTDQPEEDYILKFNLVPGLYPRAEAVAEAIIAYVDTVRTAAGLIDPMAQVAVEIVGVEEGSQIFKLALRRMESAGERMKRGADEYPLVGKAAMALGSMIASAVVGQVIVNAISPDPRIPDDQMEVFQNIEEDLRDSVELQRQSADLFGGLQAEPAFMSVQILSNTRVPIITVPRDEFALRGGVFTPNPEPEPDRIENRVAVWDVTLIKPALIPEKRRWTFARDGIEFSALMVDQAVLDAIHNKTLPIQIAEGVVVKIEIQYRERYSGSTWITDPASRRVTRLLQPLPPASPSLPLFPASGRP
ncbi:hypothetical protein M527_29120 [Sphingobium indicum IP26]|uniref:hypothetical protein n=1 Tax=Sphingobium sp. HDIP04 TaxID=428994 RepID=UPI000379D687|nr:hypothetical protein [Sphingobium sp. HDIP04]EPR14178.1 hypothetical protein M527_29120 [Sphingobium indicum IP26]EQB03662.1 hypothetical protein L286_11590 [Sphingobium sp. HDIP04]